MRIANRSRRGQQSFVEALEPRQLLSTIQQAIPLGSLVGRKYLTNQFLSKNNPSAHQNIYQFSTSRFGRVDVQLSRLNGFVSEDCDILLLSETDTLEVSNHTGAADESVSAFLAAGNYAVKVLNKTGTSDAHYTLALASDFAPQFVTSTGFDTTTGRDFGTVSEASSSTANDFVGYLDGSDRDAQDLDDMMLFDVPAAGHISVTVDHLATDPNGASFDIEGALYKDFNGNGTFDFATDEVDNPDDTFDTTSPSQPLSFSDDVSPGQWGFRVVQNTGGGFPHLQGGSNYLVTLTYTANDTAGNTSGTARDVGVLDNPTRSFSDYLSANDTNDFFKFTSVNSGGPFTFDGQITDAPAGANFTLDLIRASDNGVIFSGVPLNQPHTAQLVSPGSYFARVRRVGGEGAYTLSMSSGNQDIAGNTLATALDITLLQGHRHFSDTVSLIDSNDIFKLRINVAGTVNASLDATDSNTDADLFLFNSTGALLRGSTNRRGLAESISTPLAIGTYFVEVHDVTGTPTYSLDMNLDTAGNNANTARTLDPTGNANEFVSPTDLKDTFAVTVAGNQRLGAFFLFLHDPINVSIGRDTNANLVLDATEKVLNTTITTSPSSGISVAANLTAGAYLIEITSVGSVGTNYSMSLATAPFDNAGNALDTAAARNLGTLGSSVVTVKDFLGDGSSNFLDDSDDFYRFNFGSSGPYNLSASIQNLQSTLNADIQLIRDDNNDTHIDSNEILASSATGGLGVGESLVKNITVPGTYFLRVLRAGGTGQYDLSLSATSTDTAGNFLSAANDLGPIGNGKLVQGFVSRIDPVDFFHISVPAASELSTKLGTLPLPVFMDVIRDVNGNGSVDAGDVLATSDGSVRPDDLLNGVFLPAAGDYFVAVRANGIDTSYGLILAPSKQTPFSGSPIAISNTATNNRIEIENFDSGGDPDAYHDTDPADGPQFGVTFRSNENVDLRNTGDPQDPGFRNATTNVGEYLEYTVNVLQDDLFNFEFRVSSPGDGAAFHLDVDGVNVTGSVVIPNTGGVDNMTTVPSPISGIALEAGPHIFRVTYDAQTGGDPDIAGTMNFINVRSTSASTGIFELRPGRTSVVAEQDLKLGLKWTVPSGSWHTLNDIEFQLTDQEGIALQVKFDEAHNTLALYDPKKHRYGDAKAIGSNAELSNHFGTVHLATTTVQGDGPDAPGVLVTLDLTFTKHTRGRNLTVLVAASDDAGRHQAFDEAGLIDVV